MMLHVSDTCDAQHARHIMPWLQEHNSWVATSVNIIMGLPLSMFDDVLRISLVSCWCCLT
jgi:hypothetical protein